MYKDYRKKKNIFNSEKAATKARSSALFGGRDPVAAERYVRDTHEQKA
jgi:hypothetical protein